MAQRCGIPQASSHCDRADIKHFELVYCPAGNMTYLLIGVKGISLDDKGGFRSLVDRDTTIHVYFSHHHVSGGRS